MKKNTMHVMYIFLLLCMMIGTVQAAASDSESELPPLFNAEPDSVVPIISESVSGAYMPLVHTQVPEKNMPMRMILSIMTVRSDNAQLTEFVRGKREREAISSPQVSICYSCNKSFTQKSHLNEHIKHVHEKITYQCSYCEKSFSTKSNLNKHIKSFHERKIFQCSSCDKNFTEKGNLDRHIKNVHLGKRFPCAWCAGIYTDRSYLATHIRAQHPEADISMHKKQRKNSYDAEVA